MQERLALARSAVEVMPAAIVCDLCRMPGKRFPAFDLSFVLTVVESATPIVPAVPLEPPARIVFVYPSFFDPLRKGLTRMDLKEIYVRIRRVFGELCRSKPTARKLIYAIAHVYAIEHSEGEHFFRSELWFEFGIKMFARRLGEFVRVPALHSVVDGDASAHAGSIANENEAACQGSAVNINTRYNN